MSYLTWDLKVDHTASSFSLIPALSLLVICFVSFSHHQESQSQFCGKTFSTPNRVWLTPYILYLLALQSKRQSASSLSSLQTWKQHLLNFFDRETICAKSDTWSLSTASLHSSHLTQQPTRRTFWPFLRITLFFVQQLQLFSALNAGSRINHVTYDTSRKLIRFCLPSISSQALSFPHAPVLMFRSDVHSSIKQTWKERQRVIIASIAN